MANYVRKDLVDLDQESMLTKLMRKVTEQAQELSDVYGQLDNSSEYIARLEQRLNDKQINVSSSVTSLGSGKKLLGASDVAVLKRNERDTKEKINALQKQVQVLENRLQESNKSKKSLINHNDIITKENKALERKIRELMVDPQDPHSISIPKSSGRLKTEKDMQRYIYQLEQDLKRSNDRIHDLENNSNKYSNQTDHHTNDDDKDGYIESLERQIVLLQQKLQYLAQDHDQHTNNQISEQANEYTKKIKDIEHERDILLEYIHDDLEKNGKTLEKLAFVENELKICKDESQVLQKTIENLEENLNKESGRKKILEDELVNAHEKLLFNAKRIEMLEDFEDKYHNEKNKTQMDSEEAIKVKQSLLTEIRDKDAVIQSQSDDLRKLKARIHEIELSNSLLQHDNDSLKQRLDSKDSEIQRLLDKIHSLVPVKNELEPELQRLKLEKNDLVNYKHQLESELEHLRHVDRIIKELNSDLTKSKHHNNKSDNFMWSPGPSLDTIANSSNSFYGPSSPSLGKQESGVGLGPVSLGYIRKLFPVLYDYISGLESEVKARESAHHESRSLIQSLTKDITNLKSAIELDKNNSHQNQEHSNKLLDQYRRKLEDVEQENLELRSNRAIMQQIRYTIETHINDHSSLTDNRKHHYSDTSFKRSEGDRDQNVSITDRQLPDLISRVIMQQSHTVMILDELKQEYDSAQTQLKSSKSIINDLQGEINKLRAEVNTLRVELKTKEHALIVKQSTSEQDMLHLKSLVEKQTEVTQTYEAKAQVLERDIQLKTSQIQTLKQREESFRRRIYRVLETYSDSIGLGSREISSMIPEDTSVSDLLDYLSDILRSFAHKLSSKTARQLMTSMSSPATIVPPTPDTSNDTVISNIHPSGNETMDSLMVSPDTYSSVLTDDRPSPVDERPKFKYSQSIKSRANAEKISPIQRHVQLQDVVQNSDTTVKSEYNHNTAQEIQKRLFKAQLALNSMKES